MARTRTYRTQTCTCGRQTKRLFYTNVGKRCGECIKREGLRRTGAPEWQSRAKRLDAALKPLYEAIESGEELPEDFSDVVELKDEMENWASNMEGTNLEFTSKYEEVTEARDTLDEGISSLESAASDYNSVLDDCQDWDEDNADQKEDKEEWEGRLADAKSQVEDALSTLEGVSFPGMYY